MYWVGSQSLAPNGEQTNKILEKFQTDFWFICHLQIKARVTAVACQHPGRNLAGFICYFCRDVVAAAGQMKPAGLQLSLNPSIVLLSPTFPTCQNHSRQMYLSGQ